MPACWSSLNCASCSREVEQRLKTEEFKRVLESTDTPDAWKQRVEGSTELRDQMAELESKLIATKTQVDKLELKLPEFMEPPGRGQEGVRPKPDPKHVPTYQMETPKKENVGGNESDVEMEAGQEQ